MPMERDKLSTPVKKSGGKALSDETKRTNYFVRNLQAEAFAFSSPDLEVTKKLHLFKKLHNTSKPSLASDLLELFDGKFVELKTQDLKPYEAVLESSILKCFDKIEELDRKVDEHHEVGASGRGKYIASFADIGTFPIRLEDPRKNGKKYFKKPEPPNEDFSHSLGTMQILLSWRGMSSLFARLWPHVLLMAVCNAAAYLICSNHVDPMPDDLYDAYALMGATLSLLLVFRTNQAYDRFYEGKKLIGVISNQLRQIVLNSYSFLAIHEDPSLARTLDRTWAPDAPAKVRQLRGRIRRMVGVLYGLTRQKLREARIGFLPASPLGNVSFSTQTWFLDQTRPCLLKFLTPREIVQFSRVLSKKRHKCVGAKVKFRASEEEEYKTGYIEGVSSGSFEIRVDHVGAKDHDDIKRNVSGDFIHPVLSFEETQEAAGSRVMVASHKLMDLTQRLTAHLAFGKSFAEAVTRNMQEILDATSACQRIVDTPLPFLYSHMLSLLLFVFVYSAPFMFTLPDNRFTGVLLRDDEEAAQCSALGWLPSLLLVLGYYGIENIAVLIENPFNFEDIDHDLEAFGKRVEDESRAIEKQSGVGGEEDSSPGDWNLDRTLSVSSSSKQRTDSTNMARLRHLIDQGKVDVNDLALIDDDGDGVLDDDEIEKWLKARGFWHSETVMGQAEKFFEFPIFGSGGSGSG